MTRPHQHLGGEALRTARKKADAALDVHICRLRAVDSSFHNALKLACALDDEAEARRR